jgi:hypothetical protein
MKRGLSILFLGILAGLTFFAQADVFLDANASRATVIAPTYFGIHFGSRILPGQSALHARWPSLTFGTVRLWDTYTRWGDVTPRPGVWDFERIDAYLTLARIHHADVLYTLGSTPRWASARPDEPCGYGMGCAAEPVRMAHWEEYVKRLAQRYRGQIYAYELWNEPSYSENTLAPGSPIPGSYFGSVAHMVELARIARNVLDEYDPNALLSSPGIVNAPQLLDQFLAAGGKHYVQAISYHFYSGNAEQFAKSVREIRSIMKRHGVESLPLWNTETGVEVHADSLPLPQSGHARTHEEAAAFIAQMLVLGASEGIDRFYYYAWENLYSGLVTENGEHLAGYEAMERVQNWLLGSRLTGCAIFDRGAVRCDGEREGQRFIVAWADNPGERILVVPKGWRVLAAEPLLGSETIELKMAGQGKVGLQLGKAPVHVLLETAIAQSGH